MKKQWSKSLLLWATLVTGIAICSVGATAQQLTLTQDGVNLGFTLTTFATLDPGQTGCCGGPFGVALAAPDRVLVYNNANETRYVFHDADGQTPSSAITSTTQDPSGGIAYATSGGNAYGGVSGSQFCQYNVDGTVNHFLTSVTQPPQNGLWTNPTNGHLLAATTVPSIIDIDPLANNGRGSARTVTSGSFDGVAVSPDGTVVYGKSDTNQHVLGYDIATGAQVYDSGSLTGAGLGNPDGTGVITSNNNLNGMLIVNFNGNGSNSGGVGLLDPITNQLTVIANGGTRGDFAEPDVSNGTIFLDYSDKVYRLSCGANCSIGQGVGPCSLPIPQCQAH